MRKTAIIGLAALAVMTISANAGESLSASERIMLQATMQQSIDRQLVDGQFLYFDRTAATVHAIFPAKTHPMIMQMGDRYILCTDFRNSDGGSVNVDFYVARQGDSFMIFDTVVDNRAPLQQLMKDGLVRVAD